MDYHVYVSNLKQSTFTRFLMDGDTGKLQARDDVELTSPAGPAAVDAREQVLFTSLRDGPGLASFGIDRKTGQLTAITSVTTESDACYVSTDRTDRYLLASYYGAGIVTVHAIDGAGSISAQPVDRVETAEHAHSILTDATNRFAFVPHTCPANMVAQFQFDPATGKLSASDPPRYHPPTPEGPRHMCFHPQLNVYYTVNEDASTVSAHQLDAASGTLMGIQTLSMLPFKVEGNSGAEIKITPDGRFVFASNRGHDSIARFAVDAASGELTALGQQPTEKMPRMFELDPTGRFLYAAGLQSNQLASYRVDGDSGALEPLDVYPVGDGPWWVQFVAVSG